MKLKSFDKVNVAVKTEYTVFNSNDEYVESFTEDYTNASIPGNGILKKMALEKKGAEVKYVSVNSATGILSVTLVVD